jgi:hypothetical protein
VKAVSGNAAAAHFREKSTARCSSHGSKIMIDGEL